MKKTALPLTLFIVLISVGFKANDNTTKQFEWLRGDWRMETKKGVIIESWNVLNDSTLIGESSMTRNSGETFLLEKIELRSRGNDYFYIPVAQGQNNNLPVIFKITSHDESGFVAENPEHNFPKRITYRQVNKDSIHAYIDGGEAMPGKKSDFYYSRVKK
ncbi:MAG: DUF6265 family protein [Bacteroidota bacterium]|nr:DUF6265 family protein [Bacteroidota bacterium]